MQVLMTYTLGMCWPRMPHGRSYISAAAGSLGMHNATGEVSTIQQTVPGELFFDKRTMSRRAEAVRFEYLG
jgi:hypothetical protein